MLNASELERPCEAVRSRPSRCIVDPPRAPTQAKAVSRTNEGEGAESSTMLPCQMCDRALMTERAVADDVSRAALPKAGVSSPPSVAGAAHCHAVVARSRDGAFLFCGCKSPLPRDLENPSERE